MVYTQEKIKEVLDFLQTHTYAETSLEFLITESTIVKWAKEAGIQKPKGRQKDTTPVRTKEVEKALYEIKRLKEDFVQMNQVMTSLNRKIIDSIAKLEKIEQFFDSA